jgi:ABC-type sugar transport system substrate-binding protein
MKFSAIALALLSTLAVSEAASLRDPSKAAGQAKPTLPNGISCRMCPDDDDYVWPIPKRKGNPWFRKLEAAAEAAKYEAAYLTDAAGKQVKDEHKSTIQAAADQAHYEASVLAEAAESGTPDDHERLLKDKTLPNGISCRMCPDDDDYVWPIPKRKGNPWF